MTDSPASLDDFADIVYNLMAHFVTRQQIVVFATLDVHPTAFPDAQEHVFGIELKPYLVAFKKRMSKAWPIGSIYQGVWKNEWAYDVHGTACKLTNLQTGEPLEWDAPDPQAIFLYWFTQRLAWRLKNEQNDPFVRKYHEAKQGKRTLEITLNRLIEQQRVFLKHNRTLVLLPQAQMDTPPLDVPDDLTAALPRLIQHYIQRQKLAIEALVSLRPDILKRRVDEPHTDPQLASKLIALYPTPEPDFKPGAASRKGVWANEWHYYIDDTCCTLTHKHTDEWLSWAGSDPQSVDLDHFQKHLFWRLHHESRNADVALCIQWIGQHRTSPSPNTPASDYYHFGVGTLLKTFVDRRIITLKYDDYSIIITLNNDL